MSVDKDYLFFGVGKDGDKSKIKLWDDVEIGSLLNVGDQLTVAGPLKVNSDIQLGPNDKRIDAGKIHYGDMLEITGAGKGSDPRKIKMSDDVEIAGHLKTLNQTGTDQLITGTQSVNNQTVTGIQTLNNTQKLLGGQEVAGVSSYKGKVNINPTETDRRNMVDLSIGDELTGFRKGEKSIMFTGNTKEIGGFDEESLFINKQSPIEFGKGVTKEVNAGKIAYKKFSDGLDIVGASPEGVTAWNTDRKIKLWDNVEIQGGLTVKGPINMPELKQGPQFTVGDVIELAKDRPKEQNAGKIVYKGHGGGQSLDIIGASPGNTVVDWKNDRKIELWDDVRVQNNLVVSGPTTKVRDLNITGTLSIGEGRNKWFITAKDERLHFSHADINNQDNYGTNAGHTFMDAVGNLWLARYSEGYVADSIKDVRASSKNAQDGVAEAKTAATNAQDTATSAFNKANDALSKKQVRVGRGGNGHIGQVSFDPPFVGVDPARIRVVATCDGATWDDGWMYQIVVHVAQVTLNGFRYSLEGQSGTIGFYENNVPGTKYTQTMFGPGEGFNYIAIAM